MSDDQPTSRRAARLAAQQAAEVTGPSATSTRSGLLGSFRAHPMGWSLSALAVVFVLLGAGAVYAGVAVASPKPLAVARVVPTTPPPRPTPSDSPTASRVRTCSVDGPASDPRLKTLTGSVVRTDTGEVLWDHGASTPSTTGSTIKLLIASSAIAVLGPGYQIATDVVDGSVPGSIVLVGHGDPTISALPAGQQSVYVGAPKLSDLAAETLSAYGTLHPGVPITQVVLDASYWNLADRWDPSWSRTEQTGGDQSEVTALQVDGDRQNPRAETSPRSTDPVGRAGAAFIAALQAADPGGLVASSVTTSSGTALSGAAPLGEVKSQPVSTLIKQMLLPSDNTLGEMLARIVSKVSGLNGSAASLQQAISSALGTLHVAATGLTIIDGSGESPNNRVPPVLMTTLLREVQQGVQNLDVIRDALPVAGQTGTLATRFTGANAIARGHVAAKTGSIVGAYALAGTITAADGTVLEFTFDASGSGIKDDAKAALDTLTTAVYSCGDNLSNN